MISAYRIDVAPILPPRSQPRLIPPRKAEAARSAFIERLEAGIRSPKPLPDMSPGSVLILEGDLSIRKLLRRLLDRRGYKTVEVAQAADLETELRNGFADLLVIDVSESEPIGTPALVSLARAHPGLKILALSVEASQSHQLPGRLG